MMIRDHVNMTGKNPLVGHNPLGEDGREIGPRFPDMLHCYDPELAALALQTGADLGMALQSGVFCWVTGPAYETAAEVRMLRMLGGDAVSMSTAPEVIAARQRHLRVLGISLITNLGTGLSASKLTHEEVTATADLAGERLGRLLQEIVRRLP